MDSQTEPGSKHLFHLYDDVKVFHTGEGYCHTCECVHTVASTVDLLFAGPSCKNFSGMFKDRKMYADCYETGDGSSGYTYQHGVLDAITVTNPALLYFENVLSVAQSRRLADGSRSTPAIQARCK